MRTGRFAFTDLLFSNTI